MSIPIHTLAMALAVAGACGLRSFLPLCYMCAALRGGMIAWHGVNPLARDLLSADSTLLALTVLCGLELMLEKSPRAVTAFDLPMLALRFLAAIAVSFVLLPGHEFGGSLSASTLVGAIGAISVMNLQVRQHESDVLHLPVYVNFASSLLIDGVCLASAAIAFAQPYAGLVTLYLGTWTATLLVRTWSARYQRKLTLRNLPDAPELPEEFLRRNVSDSFRG